VSGFFGYGTVSLPVVVLCIPGFTGLTREARRGDADGDERSHAEARGRTRRVLVGGVTRPSRLRALRVRSRAPHVPKDSHEGREEEMLTVMNDLTLEARRTRPGTGELPREAVRGLREYQIPWSTTPGALRWSDRPRVQPPAGNYLVGGGARLRSGGTLLSVRSRIQGRSWSSPKHRRDSAKGSGMGLVEEEVNLAVWDRIRQSRPG